MRTPRTRRIVASAAALVAIAALGGAAASAAFAPPNPTGHWKLSLTIDYSSSGTATNSRCYPDPEAITPTPISGTATDKITVRTVRSPVVEFHEAPNGIPVAMESNYTKAFRGKVSETRTSSLDSGGDPEPCYGTKPPKTDCGTESVLSGLYVNPLGGIHSWKGFTLQLETDPSSKFERCGLTDADADLPYPLEIEVKAPPRKLTGKMGKLVFRGSEKGSGKAREESVSSTATGSLKWKVTLKRAGAGL